MSSGNSFHLVMSKNLLFDKDLTFFFFFTGTETLLLTLCIITYNVVLLDRTTQRFSSCLMLQSTYHLTSVLQGGLEHILSNYPLPNDIILALAKLKVFADDKAVVGKIMISFPNKPWFLHVYITSLLKTLLEKEKSFMISSFSFFFSIFYPFE